jgi:hypothetical protein
VIVLPRGSILSISNGTLSGTLTEHGRGTMSMSEERIGSTKRTVGGKMRGSFIANKHTIDVSWTDVPSADSMTADGNKGGKWMKDFYDSTTGTVTATLLYDGTVLSMDMIMTGFSYEVSRRTTSEISHDLVSVSFTLEEV